MKLCFIGTGYVGLVSGVCFADIGYEVICVDKDKEKIRKLENGINPIYEPGLDELIQKNTNAGRLTFSDNIYVSIKKSDIIFLAVGTPTSKDGNSADLTNLFLVVNQIKKIKKHKIIVTKSTVPLGTNDKIDKILNIKNKKRFSIVSNPEFLREGEAIKDFKFPDRIVIGAKNKSVIEIMRKLYRPLISKGASFLSCSLESAELIKYASNAFLATKISFINELANLCEKAGVNVEDVAIGIGLDKRIGSRFLRAGPAYGGSCFPKDTKALVRTAKKYLSPLSIVSAVIKFNDERKKYIEDKIIKLLGSNLKKKTICFLGVTFKANTDDTRDSSAMKMIPRFASLGIRINYYDPSGEKNFPKKKNIFFFNNLYSATENIDLIVIHTEWDEFKNLDFKKILKKNRNINIYDLRNLYDINYFKNKKISYYSIGRP